MTPLLVFLLTDMSLEEMFKYIGLAHDQSFMRERHYDKLIKLNEEFLTRIFGSTETLYSFDTYQFDDYSKVFAPRFDVEEKSKRRSEVFPIYCQKAFEMGVRLISG